MLWTQADLVAKLASMAEAKSGAMEGVADVRDESDRTDGVRVVIEVCGTCMGWAVLLSPLQLHVCMGRLNKRAGGTACSAVQCLQGSHRAGWPVSCMRAHLYYRLVRSSAGSRAQTLRRQQGRFGKPVPSCVAP